MHEALYYGSLGANVGFLTFCLLIRLNVITFK